ncbi:MAG: hypothetical protein IJI06_08890 [Oscillospiraceae bacterium]|nr:hypothetical protein [Oscillospiraceae bacterium]
MSKGKPRNWSEIRAEYEDAGMSFSKLAEKHGIAIGSLKKAAAREGWAHKKSEKKKVESAAKRLIAAQKGPREKKEPEEGSALVPSSDEFGDVLEGLRSIAFETDKERVSVRDRLRALELLGKYLGLFDQRKDELDREEQRARIDKLRAETRTDDAASRTVTVRFVDIYGDDDNA